MGALVLDYGDLSQSSMIKGQYIHYHDTYDSATGNGMQWFALPSNNRGFNTLMSRYIALLNKSVKIIGPDGEKIRNLTELDDQIIQDIFDAMAMASNIAIEEAMASDRAELVTAQRIAQENVAGILAKEGKQLDDYLLAIQQALGVITNLNDDLWASFIVNYKQYLFGGENDVLRYEEAIISAESDIEIQQIMQRVFSILNRMPEYTSTKSIQSATTQITKTAIGEYAAGILNSIKGNAYDMCDTMLSNVRGSSVKVLRQGKQQTVGARQIGGGTGKVDLLSKGNRVQITLGSQSKAPGVYILTGELNSSVKWYRELKRTTYKTERDIHIQKSSSFMAYVKQVYTDNLELYGIYNSIAFSGNSIASQNYKIVKKNVINSFLEQMLAGKGGGDLASFVIINGRKIPILAILQEYINTAETGQVDLVYIHTSQLENVWKGGEPRSIKAAWKRSNELHKAIDNIGMSVTLDRHVIYELGRRYGLT